MTATTELRAAQAALPFAIAEQWDVACVYERSFKMSYGKLLANRYLLAFRASDLTPPQCLGIARQLGLQAEATNELGRWLPRARLLLIGFEDEGDAANYKVYLELDTSTDESTRPVAGAELHVDAVLKHVGFKWTIGAETVLRRAQYLWYPRLTVSAIRSRLQKTWVAQSPSLRFAQSCLSAAEARELAGVQEPLVDYIESNEDRSSRQAFDFNLYRLGWKVEFVAPQLRELAEAYAVDLAQFQRWADLAEGGEVGHLSAGLDRYGREFATLYYLPNH